jgi:chromate transporter
MAESPSNAGRRPGSALEVGRAFLGLGLRSFGGPIAHLGYFRREFVLRRRWLDEHTYSELIALCQFLPGPTSSQVGVAIGLGRAGYPGALAAFAGFTLPSALLLGGFAWGAEAAAGPPMAALAHGLGLAAVAVVTQAVAGMARVHCPDRIRGAIAWLAAAIVLAGASAATQVGAIALGAALGAALCRTGQPIAGSSPPRAVSARAGGAALGAFVALLFVLPLAARLAESQWLRLLDAFYRAGALVFGGGHVVLPLLREAFVAPGWVTDADFLAGYGAAQAVPGPLFSFAAYLGAIARPGWYGLGGALLGVVGLFLPGMLLLIATLPFWDRIRPRSGAPAAIAGANAAVVGVLGAALVGSIVPSAIQGPADLAIAAAAIALLMRAQATPIVVVALCALGGFVSLAGFAS